MPNSISGSLKIRGKYDDVKRFFEEVLNTYRCEWDDEKKISKNVVNEKSDWLVGMEEYGEVGERSLEINIKPGEWVYVEGTSRAFITSDFICMYERKNRAGSIIPTVAFCEIRQAWCFRKSDWLKIAKEYNVDVRVWGLERGMEFGQETIIENGTVTKDEEFYYKDWDWESPMPWLGG